MRRLSELQPSIYLSLNIIWVEVLQHWFESSLRWERETPLTHSTCLAARATRLPLVQLCCSLLPVSTQRVTESPAAVSPLTVATSWLGSAEFNKFCKTSCWRKTGGQSRSEIHLVTLKMVTDWGREKPSAALPVSSGSSRYKWKTEVHRKVNFLVGWDRTVWQSLPSILSVRHVYLQSASKRRRRG